MSYGLRVITGPTSEPVSIAEVRQHCRIDATDDDAGIARRILAARTYVEQITGRALMTQTLEMLLEEFPEDDIHLPRSPAASITWVKYTDPAGVVQTMSASDYVLDNSCVPSEVYPAYGKFWPPTLEMPGSVQIRYVAGEEQAPEPIRQAILLLVAAWDENRSGFDAVPGVDALLAPYQASWF